MTMSRRILKNEREIREPLAELVRWLGISFEIRAVTPQRMAGR